ncbi:hypothetical protein PENTCL1PPCAC_15526, partial [Pristionchus entomophagus]
RGTRETCAAKKLLCKVLRNSGLVGGQICLEYVENSRMMNLHDNHTVDKLKQVARAIGKIHACSLKNEVTAPELHTTSSLTSTIAGQRPTRACSRASRLPTVPTVRRNLWRKSTNCSQPTTTQTFQ